MLDKIAYEFMHFIAKHGKAYETLEDWNTRPALFTAAYNFVEEHNSGSSTYKAGLNQFSDWTDEERSKLLGIKEQHVNNEPKKSGVAPNDSVDWRDVSGVVTPVKDQGACGSCWAFSATETVESAYVIAGNDQVIMAPQELVDCARGLFSNHGCNGGWYYYAWKWLESNMSMTEADYPYTSGTTGEETTCAYDAAEGVTYTTGYAQCAENTDSIKACIEQGPVSVAV